MKEQPTILWDIDGVLADFCWGFTEAAGLKPWSHTVQQAWDFDEHLFPKHLQASTWEKVTNTPWWWVGLPSLLTRAPEEEAFRRIVDRNDIQHVFCTHRQGTPNAQQQSQMWLCDELGVQAPSVVLSKRKGEVARAIGATYAIDDKAQNCSCIHWFSDTPQTKVYVLDRPYNRIELPKRVRRVASIEEFIEDVEHGR